MHDRLLGNLLRREDVRALACFGGDDRLGVDRAVVDVFSHLALHQRVQRVVDEGVGHVGIARTVLRHHREHQVGVETFLHAERGAQAVGRIADLFREEGRGVQATHVQGAGAEQLGDLVRVFAEGHHAVFQFGEFLEARLDVVLVTTGQFGGDDDQVHGLGPVRRRQEDVRRRVGIPQGGVAGRGFFLGAGAVDQTVAPQQVTDTVAIGAGAVFLRYIDQVGNAVEVGFFQQVGGGQTFGADACQGDDVVLRTITTGLELGDHFRGAAGAVGDDLAAVLVLEGCGDVAQCSQAGVIGPGQQTQGLAGKTCVAGIGLDERHAHGCRCNRGYAHGLDELTSVQIMLAHYGLPLFL
ncbi:hypothetical protein D3C81_1333140 [compost metagenome]